MQIAQAKQISLAAIVENLGGRYSHTDRKGDLWYFSPFRPEEKHASFKINTRYNNWHDFGHSGVTTYNGKSYQGSGGDIIDLWCDYNSRDRKSGIKEALAGLSKYTTGDYQASERRAAFQKENKPVAIEEPRFKILEIADEITFSGLLKELNRRKISVELANLWLKQGYILDTATDKKYNGFLFENEKGGYEVSIPNRQQEKCFKTCIGAKAMTIVKSDRETANGDVFEGFWDYLSWLEKKEIKIPIHYTFILNSTSLVREAVNKFTDMKDCLKSLFLFMDNDPSGRKATQIISDELKPKGFEVGNMDQFYKGYKDFGDYWRLR